MEMTLIFSAVQRTEEFQKDAERRLFFLQNEEEMAWKREKKTFWVQKRSVSY